MLRIAAVIGRVFDYARKRMGLATVRAALAQGAEVVAAGRRPVGRREPAAGARQEVVDITSEESVRELFHNVGELDHLLVTASPGSPGAFLEQDLASARTYMDGKFFGSWTCARFAAPRIRARGSITFVTGGAVVRPPAHGSMIAAAFAAIEALTRALAVELGPQRVVERQGMAGGAPLLIRGDREDLSHVRQGRGQPLDSLRENAVIVGDENPRAAHGTG